MKRLALLVLIGLGTQAFAAPAPTGHPATPQHPRRKVTPAPHHQTPPRPSRRVPHPVVPAPPPPPSIDVQPYWKADLREYVVTTCGTGAESFCQAVCGDSATCVQPEGYCRDCAGTSSLLLKDILDNVGDVYVSDGGALPLDTVAQYLKTGAFVSLTADTVYNYFDTYNSGDLQARFERLCYEPTPRPVLFLDADPQSREIKGVNFVLCHGKRGELQAFKVSRSPEIDRSGTPAPQQPTPLP